MNASELRIGNWVYGYRMYFQIANINKSHVEPIGNEGEFCINDLDPIEISKEHLLLCGFNIDRNGDYFIHTKSRIFIWFNKGNCSEMDIFQDGKNISFARGKIKYLHQLQNFYFELTGEDLQIDLTQ